MVAAVAQEEDEAAATQVALFCASPSDDRLNIADVGLGFDHRVEFRPDRKAIGAP